MYLYILTLILIGYTFILKSMRLFPIFCLSFALIFKVGYSDGRYLLVKVPGTSEVKGKCRLQLKAKLSKNIGRKIEKYLYFF